VTVVVPTKDRPQLLQRAVDAVLRQDYPGDIECLVVFDGTEPRLPKLEVPAGRTLRALVNERTPGLAGNRNTGYLAASGDVVAACDDDDEWFPHKLRTQVPLFSARPEASCVASGSTFHFEGHDVDRPAGRPELTFDDLLAERHPEVHISTCVFPRRLLLETIGLVDEKLPAGYAEDFELMLRAARIGPIVCVRQPLARVYQHRSSFFADKWRTMDEALAYLIDQVPEFERAPTGLARMEGQRAFAKAAAGDRRQAVQLAVRSLRRSPKVKQSWFTFIVAAGVMKPEQVLTLARRFGRGI
jgi:glycosyltransferase involved in cell wall biosynthesis